MAALAVWHNLPHRTIFCSLIDNSHLSACPARLSVDIATPPSVAICTRVDPHRALELGLLGETISAEEAVRIGLDNRSVPADAWRSTVNDMALRLASGFNRIP